MTADARGSLAAQLMATAMRDLGGASPRRRAAARRWLLEDEAAAACCRVLGLDVDEMRAGVRDRLGEAGPGLARPTRAIG